MAEPSLEVAKRQFNKFVNSYNTLHKTSVVWDCVNPNQNDNWDFRGYDRSGEKFLNVQYTEAIVNHRMKGKLEAFKRGKYKFEFAINLKFATQMVEEAYGNKLKIADKNTILLIGFHDFDYEKENKHDGVEKIRAHIKKKYKFCAFKELWIVNKDDSSCDFIF